VFGLFYRNDPFPTEERLDRRRNLVRISITYTAGVFLFIFGPAVILILIFHDESKHIDEAMNLFNVILPISSAIVSYWFAGRKSFDNVNQLPNNGLPHPPNNTEPDKNLPATRQKDNT